MRSVLGTCHHDCPDSCGWIVEIEDGVATRMRGNPDHPYSLGELCPKVNRFLDRVYSPDRILHPLIRTGPKGTASFRRATWDEALDLTASRLREIVQRSGGEAVLPWWDAGTQGLLQMSSLDRRLFAKLEASRLTGSLCGGTAAAGTAAAYGTAHAADPLEVRHAKLVLLWGTNTKLTNRHLWPFVEEARANGATVVVIDPIRTITAESADWFLQPLPGTDVALMLGMMHVLVRDGLVDTGYVEQHAAGFDELCERVAAWTPQRAADATGLEAEEVEDLARLYGTVQPAFIRTLIGAEHHENGAEFFRTLAALPVLVGAWRHRGGGLARSVSQWFDTVVDDSVFDAPSDTRSVNMTQLGQALTSLQPPIEALVVWNGNPAVTVPNVDLIRQGLLREDLFTMVSEQFMTDTAAYADVVFPAATQIEQVDVVPAWGHLYLGWNEPAIEPPGEAVPNTELWRRLAAALGFTDPELFEPDESLLRSALPGVDFEQLRSRGWIRLDMPTNLYAEGGFATPDGRAHLVFDGGPGFTPSSEALAAAGRFPLTLLTPKQHLRLLNTSYTHLPGHGAREGGPFVEMDPVDAAARGLTDGDRARVWNDRGSLTLTVKVSGRLRPGVVAVPFGWWYRDHGGEGVANTLTSDRLTDAGGGVAYSDTRVQVEPAG